MLISVLHVYFSWLYICILLTQVQQPYSLSEQSCSCQASPRSYGAQECSCIFCIPNDQRIVGGMRRSSRVSKPTRRSLEAKESEQDYHNHQLEAEQEKRTIHESLHNSAQRAKRRREDSTERKKQVSAFAESRKQYYTPKELLALSAEDATFPGAIPLGHIDKIIKRAQALYHGDYRICSVCDHFVLYADDIADYEVPSLPSTFFTRLLPPDGSLTTCKELDPLLREQYNAASFFSTDATRFGALLLSRRAFKRQCNLHPLPVSDSSAIDYVKPRVPVCQWCFRSLNVKRKIPQPPKNAIANGLYHGELPDALKGASRIDIKVVTPAYLGGSKCAFNLSSRHARSSPEVHGMLNTTTVRQRNTAFVATCIVPS